MKKVILSVCLVLWVVVFGFSQNNLTQDQIRRHANELGVPYEALQNLVDSYRPQTGLSNSNAKGARLLSIQELNFMKESNMLSMGAYYIVQARYYNQNGRRVNLDQGSDNLYLDAGFLVSIPKESNVIALIGVRSGSYGDQELFLVEIAGVR